MYKKCGNCRLVNSADADLCIRCETRLVRPAAGKPKASKKRQVFRLGVCITVVGVILTVFFLSLIATSRSLDNEQKAQVRNAIGILRESGFEVEASNLERFAVFRSSDNWFNSLIPKEDAFAATNFPFFILTLYPEFFAYPSDDLERAAILLHEARHLTGGDEHDAYDHVWRNRERLGWSRNRYYGSTVWQNVRKQTREVVPELFSCPDKDYDDCTEWASPGSQAEPRPRSLSGRR